MILGISGTPGVGKTSIGLAVAKALNAFFVELSPLAIEKKLYTEFDEERQSYVIDEEAVRKEIERLHNIHGDLVVAGHYVEILGSDLVELVVVLRLNPLLLIDRLRKRGWSDRKIAENVEAELLSVCTLNAVEELGEDKVVELDVTNRSVDEVANEIIDILLGEKPTPLGHRIDWLSIMREDELDKVIRFISTARSTP